MSPQQARLRARDLGVAIGPYPIGPLNAITDVPGVAVGHATVNWGAPDLAPGHGPARTGVTIIWPQASAGDYGAALLRNPVAAGFFALSGTGELTARSEVEELGRINTPIALTGTMQVGLVYDAICRYLIERISGVGDSEGVVIPIVAECDDSYLHDARGAHLTHEHVYSALDAATTGPVAEGCVGGGAGMICFGVKGGIGSSSRRLPAEEGGWTVGALVMTNFGHRPRLTFAGVPLGPHLPPAPWERPAPSDRGSCIVVLATDAPLDGRQLTRVAKRGALGLGRTGSHGGNGSGELLLAFSTTYRPSESPGIASREVVEGDAIDSIFIAAIDSVEEAVLNAICMAVTTTGRHNRVVPALDLDMVRRLLAQYPHS